MWEACNVLAIGRGSNSPAQSLESVLARPGSALLMDGGLASELQKRFPIDGTPLWSAKLIKTQPDAIVEAHKAYLRAGANIITTSSYQASLAGFAAHLGTSDEQGMELMRDSVRLARRAIREYRATEPDAATRPLFVAGSVGPYGAALADGSEYTGEYMSRVGRTELREWHKPRIEALLDAGCDVLALETMPSAEEALAVASLLEDQFPAARAWVSFTCRDAKTTSRGEPILDAVAALAAKPQILAVGVNCCDPKMVPLFLRAASARIASDRETDRGSTTHLLAYPNSGQKWDHDHGWHGSTQASESCAAWLREGARLVGGCCTVGPDRIRRFRQIIDSGKPCT